MFEEVVVAKVARFDWEIGYMENETRAFHGFRGVVLGHGFWGI